MSKGANANPEELAALLSSELQSLEARLEQRIDTLVAAAKSSAVAEDVSSLQGAAPQAKAQVDQLKATRASLYQQYSELQRTAGRLEQEIVEAKNQLETAQARVETLEAEATELQKENRGLDVKVQALEDNIDRMKRLSEELMTKITDRSQQMANMVGAGSDD